MEKSPGILEYLPPEVLQRVFQLCIESEENTSTTIASILNVNSSWRSNAQQVLQIWSPATVASPSLFSTQILTRCYRLTELDVSFSQIHPTRFVEVVRNCAPFLHSVSAAFTRIPEAAIMVAIREVNNLTSLCYGPQGCSIQLVYSLPSRIRRLHLGDLDSSETHMALKELRRLTNLEYLEGLAKVIKPAHLKPVANHNHVFVSNPTFSDIPPKFALTTTPSPNSDLPPSEAATMVFCIWEMTPDRPQWDLEICSDTHITIQMDHTSGPYIAKVLDACPRVRSFEIRDYIPQSSIFNDVISKYASLKQLTFNIAEIRELSWILSLPTNITSLIIFYDSSRGDNTTVSPSLLALVPLLNQRFTGLKGLETINLTNVHINKQFYKALLESTDLPSLRFVHWNGSTAAVAQARNAIETATPGVLRISPRVAIVSTSHRPQFVAVSSCLLSLQ